MPYVGQPLPRREDRRLIFGRGRYTDDIRAAGAAHAAFVRSPYAHARVVALRITAAAVMPGVLAVLTAADYAADGHGAIPQLPNPADAVEPMRPAFVAQPGRPVVEIAQPPLAAGRVRYAGEAVALVVAETAAAARDAAERVEVEYEELRAVASALDALEPGAPQLWDEAPGNVAFDLEYGDAAGTDRALAACELVLWRDFVDARVIAAHLEPRAAIGSYDPARESYHVVAGSQGVIRQRIAIAAALRVPPERVRVESPDVGGAFGARNNVHVEPVLVAWAARRVGRPVRWTADRSEGFVTDFHGRDVVIRATIGFARDGRIGALRFDHVGNLGAHTVSFASLQNCVRIATGPYHVPVAHVRARAVLTNTTPTAPYRGAGRPEVVHAFERLLDLAARRLDLDRVAIRRVNLVPRSAFPYVNAMGLTYDSGAFEANMDCALARADWAGFPARRAASERRGRLRGIGFANYVESPVGAPRERVALRVRGEGTVEIVAGTQSSGQGHETTFAQVAADLLAVPIGSVQLITGDTDRVVAGGGTHSNRSLRLVGTLLVQLAAELWERAGALADEPESAERPDLFAVAAALEARGDELAASATLAHRIPAFPTGCAVCELELDPATGELHVERYTSVDDAGAVVNPRIVDGQTHGGIAQGLGQALFEQIAYDRTTAQMRGGSFMDYALPRAHQLPSYDLVLTEDPTAGNPLRVKGGGEAGVTPAPAAAINAICDALAPYGVEDVEMPATPEKMWNLAHGERTAQRERELANA